MRVSRSHCSVIVPTLGQSPHLAACLDALRRAGAAEIRLVVPRALDPDTLPLGESRKHVDRWINVDRPGFSAANNAAFAEVDTPFVATVNDDAVVGPRWLDILLDRLAETPGAAAVQGVNLGWDGRTIDGCGIGWNRWWQAVQIGHGLEFEGFRAPTEIFGASATATVYRRQALEQVCFKSGRFESGPFDEVLFAYYEDVDLAARLRAAGWSAFCVAEARARHAGSVSGRRLPFGGRQLIHANRHLILARILGRSWWRHWPRIATRDLLDLAGRLSAADLRGAGGLVAAAGRTLRHLPSFAHLGPATVDLEPWTRR